MVHSAQTCSCNARRVLLHIMENRWYAVHRYVLVMHAVFTIYYGEHDVTQYTDTFW